jgi:hypothetical protein
MILMGLIALESGAASLRIRDREQSTTRNIGKGALFSFGKSQWIDGQTNSRLGSGSRISPAQTTRVVGTQGQVAGRGRARTDVAGFARRIHAKRSDESFANRKHSGAGRR